LILNFVLRNSFANCTVTEFNAGLKPSWDKAESITWKNEGNDVQGWLLYPANYNPKKHYGMIVSIHGGPAAAVTEVPGGAAAPCGATKAPACLA